MWSVTPRGGSDGALERDQIVAWIVPRVNVAICAITMGLAALEPDQGGF